MAKAEAAARYAELPVPDTTEEAWRFTDLRGFDRNSFTRSPNGSVFTDAPAQLLDRDVAGMAVVTEAGIEIERAPEGIRFEALDARTTRGSTRSSGGTRSSPPTTRLSGSTVWLVHVPKGVELEKPLYVRIAGLVEGGELSFGCSSSPRNGRGSR